MVEGEGIWVLEKVGLLESVEESEESRLIFGGRKNRDQTITRNHSSPPFLDSHYNRRLTYKSRQMSQKKGIIFGCLAVHTKSGGN